jgi:hypothetical protein
MYPYMNEDAMFERLESLHREIEGSRLMARDVRGWWKRLGNLGARAWLLGGLAMRRAPRHRAAPSHHASEDVTASNVA